MRVRIKKWRNPCPKPGCQSVRDHYGACMLKEGDRFAFATTEEKP